MQLKLYLVLFFCVTAGLSSACANQLPIKESAKSNDVVLDISTDAFGPAYPKEGYILDFRLHENGLFEYDDYPAQDSPEATRGNVVVTRKRSELSKDDVRELISIAEQPSFLNAAAKYSPLRIATDATFTQTIIYKNQGHEKRIVVVDYAPGYDEAKSYYPTALVRLMQRVCQMKAKTTGKTTPYCDTSSD